MATAIRTTPTTVTVNAAFLQEIKEVNDELWQRLKELRQLFSNATSIEQHSARIVELLAELHEQLALHFALEEAYGYFEDPVLVVPSLARQAAKLRAEHRDLYSAATSMAEQAADALFAGNLPELVTRTPALFMDFDRRLRQHESFENELIMRQYDDIGVGD